MNTAQWWALAGVAVSLGMAYGAMAEGRWAIVGVQGAYAVANICWMLELAARQ